VPVRTFLPALSRLVLGLGLFVGLAPAPWALEPELHLQRAELEKLRGRLSVVSQALNEAATDHAQEVLALAKAQRAVSQASRRLQEASLKKTTLAREAAGLQAVMDRLNTHIAEGHARLASWVRHTHIHRHGGSLGKWGLDHRLGDPEPSDQDSQTDQGPLYRDNLQRDLIYLAKIGRVHQANIESLRKNLAEHERLMKTMVAQRQRLTELEDRLKAEELQLQEALHLRREKAAEIERLLGERKIEERTLKEDEARLETLMRALERQAAENSARMKPPLASHAPGSDAASPPPDSRDLGMTSAPKPATEATQLSPEPPSSVPPPLSADLESPVSGPLAVRFSQLEGQLRPPVRGPITVRFGARRPGGGSTSSGVFIQASHGSEVKAIAAGTVVFSDWLRGFGNLLIIDHGEDYHSVYGNNDVLLREEYDRIQAGDVLAHVGDSGNQGQSGLYFEIRHRSRPQDPMRWMGR
jgi:murein hydrolase activator